MRLDTDRYRIELIDESNYSSNSTDNIFQYKQQHVNEQEYKPRTQIGIKLYEGESLISSAILRSTGGASGIHQTSQIITNDILTIFCAESVFNLSIPKLTLQWLVKADDATCFQIFKFKEDFIIHRELNITRISSEGDILWQNSGADIFTTEKGINDFKIGNQAIEVRDWNNKLYKFDLDGKIQTNK
jgi:hypothetical protein